MKHLTTLAVAATIGLKQTNGGFCSLRISNRHSGCLQYWRCQALNIGYVITFSIHPYHKVVYNTSIGQTKIQEHFCPSHLQFDQRERVLLKILSMNPWLATRTAQHHSSKLEPQASLYQSMSSFRCQMVPRKLTRFYPVGAVLLDSPEVASSNSLENMSLALIQ